MALSRTTLLMAQHPEDTLTFRSLHAGPIVAIRDYRCGAGRGGPAAEECSDGSSIVLLRRGAFCKHFGRRSVTADANQAVFFSEGSTYRVSHPADCGDRGTVFVVSARVLGDIVRALDPTVEDCDSQSFPFITGPCDAAVFWGHRVLLQCLEAGAHEPLEVEETALQLVAQVLGAAFARLGLPRQRRRRGTDADHTERAEAARGYLASRLGERITLDDVARAVHASPFHLARVFRQRTGVPIHEYLNQLRLRASLERLAEGAGDLSALALELGFSSHSHFSDAFRRAFGRTPSAVRSDTRHQALRELSKDLKA